MPGRATCAWGKLSRYPGRLRAWAQLRKPALPFLMERCSLDSSGGYRPPATAPLSLRVAGPSSASRRQ